MTIKTYCPVCGSAGTIDGVSNAMYAEAVVSQAQTLDKLQHVAYLLGVPMGLGAEATFELALHHLDDFMNTLKVVAQFTKETDHQEILMRRLDGYEDRKAKLREIQEKSKEG